MNELRRRFETILRIENEPIRVNEERTFIRLLYRNRNQHRHGLYFKRLEHVRRLLAKVGTHVLWTSLQNALGDYHGMELKRPKRAIFMPISSVTLNDLKEVETLLHSLSAVILTASKKVTTELISRQHFVPFAVSVVAMLSRIFVIEQKLLSEIRGAVVETKILLTGPSDIPSKILQRGSKDEQNSEDVGEVLDGTTAAPKGIPPVPDPKHEKQEARCLVVAAKEPNSTSVKTLDTYNPRPAELEPRTEKEEKQTPSLYALLNENSNASAGAQPAISQQPFLGRCAQNAATLDYKISGTMSQPHLQMKRRVESSNIPDLHTNIKHLGSGELSVNKDVKSRTNPGPKHTAQLSRDKDKDISKPADESSCDSEDLDDIFGALDD